MGNDPSTPPSSRDAQPSHQRFTRLVDTQLDRTLGQLMVPVVDAVRDLNTQFGIRPYEVFRVRTRWSGGRRGIGQEFEVDRVVILPTPKMLDFNGLSEIVQPIGLDEVGDIRVTEISGRFEEDFFLGRDELGNPPDPSLSVWYEVEFPRLDGRSGQKRRFFLARAPYYDAEEFYWVIDLKKSHEDRGRDGMPR